MTGGVHTGMARRYDRQTRGERRHGEAPMAPLCQQVGASKSQGTLASKVQGVPCPWGPRQLGVPCPWNLASKVQASSRPLVQLMSAHEGSHEPCRGEHKRRVQVSAHEHSVHTRVPMSPAKRAHEYSVHEVHTVCPYESTRAHCK